VRGLSVVGREGFEPSTLGLRVRADRTQLGARNANYLQAPTFTDPPKYSKKHPVAPSLYAHPYAQQARQSSTRR
jgi:hypothetical protein